MRMVSMAVTLIGVIASGSASLAAGQSAGSRPKSDAGRSPALDSAAQSKVVATYCAGCHNGTMRSPSGAVLERLDTANLSENRELWTKVYRQVQGGTMPPFGAPRPDRPTYDALLSSIESGLGAAVAPATDANGQDIADRLALMLWNGAPDESLLDDARHNRLTDLATLERQVGRMLKDDRAHAFVSRFFFPWLGLDQLGKAVPDKRFFPDFDVSLRDAMASETELFVLSQLREDRDPIELWSANYTFLNEQLARHYGIPGVTGAQLRRVTFSTSTRAGLLGQASVLMVTSRHQPGQEAAYTSPAGRATWVRMHFLGAAVPQPFPGAQPVKPGLPITPQTRTLPAEPCVHCHQNFFPLGYALENFDPIGRWRTEDQAGPVDASGTFVDGTPVSGVDQLREVLLQRPDAFRTTITEKLLSYASGKPLNGWRLTPDTLIGARQILHGTTPPRWSSLIAAIARMKSLPAE